MNNIKIYLDKLYQTRMGMYDHRAGAVRELGNQHVGFATQCFTPAEEIGSNSPLRDLMQRFKDLKIKDHWNISWPDFVEQPHDQVKWMIEIAEEDLAQRTKAEENVSDEYKKLLASTDPRRK